jgi:hypothetical protein
MFARPIKDQEWLCESSIAGEAPVSVTSATVVLPRRVTRQKSQARVKALKAMICDTIALRDDWNLFVEDSVSNVPHVPRRKACAPAKALEVVNARRHGLRAWIDAKAAERRAYRAAIEAEHAALFAEDEVLRGALWVEDEVETAPPPSAAMQLSAHLISVALIAVALPLGVMALVCTILRGGDMRIAARMSTLTGFAVLALSNNLNLLQLAM